MTEYMLAEHHKHKSIKKLICHTSTIVDSKLTTPVSQIITTTERKQIAYKTVQQLMFDNAAKGTPSQSKAFWRHVSQFQPICHTRTTNNML